MLASIATVLLASTSLVAAVPAPPKNSAPQKFYLKIAESKNATINGWYIDPTPMAFRNGTRLSQISPEKPSIDNSGPFDGNTRASITFNAPWISSEDQDNSPVVGFTAAFSSSTEESGPLYWTYDASDYFHTVDYLVYAPTTFITADGYMKANIVPKRDQDSWAICDTDVEEWMGDDVGSGPSQIVQYQALNFNVQGQEAITRNCQAVKIKAEAS